MEIRDPTVAKVLRRAMYVPSYVFESLYMYTAHNAEPAHHDPGDAHCYRASRLGSAAEGGLASLAYGAVIVMNDGCLSRIHAPVLIERFWMAKPRSTGRQLDLLPLAAATNTIGRSSGPSCPTP